MDGGMQTFLLQYQHYCIRKAAAYRASSCLLAHLTEARLGGLLLFLHSSVTTLGKGSRMKLQVWNGEKFEGIDLSIKDMDGLWISLDLESSEGLSEEEKAVRLQEEFDQQFNAPELRNHRNQTRHLSHGKKTWLDGDYGEAPSMLLARNKEVYLSSVEQTEYELDYEEQVQRVRAALHKHPNWAEAFIAVVLDNLDVKDYADSIRVKANTVSQWLTRSRKVLKKFIKTCQI